MMFYITFKPWLSVRVFPQGCLASSINDEVASHKIDQHCKRENVRFPNCREIQVDGDSTRTKKLKLQYKVAAWVSFRRVQLKKPDSLFHSAGIFVFFARSCSSSHLTLHCVIFFLTFPDPIPIT